MKPFVLIAALWAVAGTACAKPEEDVAQAINACFAAVIDGRPPSALTLGATTIRFTHSPPDCTIRAMDGPPEVLREQVLAAMRARAEGFIPAQTRWEPMAYGRRETFCLPPGGRHLFVLMSTAEPDAKGTRLMATVMESAKPDPRCYADKGEQRAIIRDYVPPPK
jgi:hypothetical protein